MKHSCHNKNKTHTQIVIQESKNKTIYTCPMHPEIKQEQPGSCPICGMALEPILPISHDSNSVEAQKFYKKFLIALFTTIPIIFLETGNMLHSNLPMSGNISNWIQFLLCTIVIFYAGSDICINAWNSFKERALNMFSLIGLGVLVAYFASIIAFIRPDIYPEIYHNHGFLPLYFESSATIVLLVILGQFLEEKARAKTHSAIQALLEQGAKSAWKIVDGKEIEVNTQDIQVGDILRVRPGERVPVDGVVINGIGIIDESSITGESIPITKNAHDFVTASTINLSSSFLMQAKKVGNETLYARIIQLVAQAQRSKARIQSKVDKVASYFVPFVIALSLITFFSWLYLGPSPSLSFALVNAVSVLIISCPCALGLATPLSIMVAMGKGAQNGIFIKNIEALEKLYTASTLLLDKTGTITEGKPHVSEVLSFGSLAKDQLIKLAASIETNSEHPYAKAIVSYAKTFSYPIVQPEYFNSIAGHGVIGKVQGHDVAIGTDAYLKSLPVKNPDTFENITTQLNIKSATTFAIAVDGFAQGIFILQDTIKSTAQESITHLKKIGLKIIILSGDTHKAVQSVAEVLGISDFHAKMTPEDKFAFIKSIKNDGNIVAMAGDGTNDAPALALADISIAMGNGTDVAIESSDISLLHGDLRGIIKAIHLSHATLHNIYENLFYAFTYNVMAIPIAAGALYPFTGTLLSPMIAALAMSLSSLSVVVNSLRLKKLKL